jgi:hypothetical protein
MMSMIIANTFPTSAGPRRIAEPSLTSVTLTPAEIELLAMTLDREADRVLARGHVARARRMEWRAAALREGIRVGGVQR